MRPHLSEHTLVALCRQCFITPRCQAAHLHRQAYIGPHPRAYSSQRRIQLRSYPRFHGQRSNHNQSEDNSEYPLAENLQLYSKVNADAEWLTKPGASVAVLGGGITGLSTAYYLARYAPSLKVTLYEGSDRLGGWVHSKYINVGDGEVVFEQGPRTLRPNTTAGLVTLNLIRDLGLNSQLLVTNRNSVAAQNRFVYYPDHLVRMPGPGQDIYATLWSMLTEPAFAGLWAAKDEYDRPQRPLDQEDESVGSFLSRRLGGPEIVNNLASAVLHGIYAGDIYKLSARSILPSLWHRETRYPSLTRSILSTMTGGRFLPKAELVSELGEVGLFTRDQLKYWKDVSVYTFRRGLGTLPEALEESLRSNPNVTIKLGKPIQNVDYGEENDSIKILTSDGESTDYDRAICTLSGRTLSTLAPNKSLPSLAKIESVTVMVVNLYFREEDLLPERGFGYLIPRSIPFEQNPEFALGVVFDTDATIGQDSVPGTKITVMLGGHWWSDRDTYPDEEEGAAMAKAVVKRHLKIEQEPEKVHVSLHKDCIPQYTVGHHSRMKLANYELRATYRGHLAVAGSSYTGVGFNDCIQAAKSVVRHLLSANYKTTTGLENFSEPDSWGVLPPSNDPRNHVEN